MFGEQATEMIYRGLRLDTFDWVYGYLIVRKERCFIATYEALDFMVISKGEATLRLIEVAPETVCVYTLKNDRDDIKIFVGDILETTVTTPSPIDAIYRVVVTFDDNIGVYADGPTPIEPYLFRFCRIVGNVINNPELLDEIEWASCE